MTQAQIASNPFALMMNPDAVFAEIERSGRLSRLSSRICRPLDKPMIAHADAAGPPRSEDDVDAWLEAQASKLGDC
jgi:hypothetical protein